MSTSKETGSKGQFDPPQELSFNQTPCGSQVLQARVEDVIKQFNKAMEEGEARMGRIKMSVMKEAKAVIAALEDAEAKRQEELGRKMNELIEKLTGDLEVMGHQEEELRQFSSSLALFIKDMPMI